jgi:hypothetical protein
MTANYRQSGGTWYVVDGSQESVFNSEQEAHTFMAKIETAKAIVKAVQSLALATDTAADLEAEYFDTQGAGWVDADVAA